MLSCGIPGGKRSRVKAIAVCVILAAALWYGYVLIREEGKAAKVPAEGDLNLPVKPTEAELASLDNFARGMKGALVYTRGGRVRKVEIGSWETTDLGEGEFARWGPDGGKIAVYDKGVIYVMNADGSARKRLVSIGGKAEHCPIEFHANGEEIIYISESHELCTVRVTDGSQKSLGVSGNYDGEPGISAGGDRLAARNGHNLLAIDLLTGQVRRYGRGCSAGISPDGNWLMCNLSAHRGMAINDWSGERQIRVNSKTCEPDRSWDNHHWSNSNDYIAAQGSGKEREAYVFCLSRNQCTRLTWEGNVLYPDLYVENAATNRNGLNKLSLRGTQRVPE